jgi:hypothetical protein
MSAGLENHAPQVQRSAVDPDTGQRDFALQKPVFVILRRVLNRWTANAKVVAVHDSEADALADLVQFRAYDPASTFSIFVPLPEDHGGTA